MNKNNAALIPLITTLPFAIATPAWAESNQILIDRLDIAEAEVTIPVSKGYGMVLDFSGVGQTVKAASLADPSRIVISGIDGNLCYLQEKCQGSGASVIRLSQVSGINLPGLTSAADGGTTLTLITDGKAGRKVLQMRVLPVQEKTYTALVVAPGPIETQNQLPIAQKFISTPNFNIKATQSNSQNLQRHNLSTTNQKKQAFDNTNHYKISKLQQYSPVVQNDSPNEEVFSSVPVRSFSRANSSMPKSIDFQVRDDLSRNKTESKRQLIDSVGIVANTVSASDVRSDLSNQLNPMTAPEVDDVVAYNLIEQQLQRINDARALTRGLWIAMLGRTDLVNVSPKSQLYRQIRTAIAALLKANSRAEAAAIAQIDLDLVEQLIYIGQNHA